MLSEGWQIWIFWAVAVIVIVISVLAGVATFTGVTVKDILDHKKGMAKITANILVNELNDEPLFVSYQRKNRVIIPSDFIKLDECTIMLFIFIPDPGQSLRNAPENRYIFGHETPKTNFNRFSLRYSFLNEWVFELSNNKGELHNLVIADGLETGWHQFIVTWNRTLPSLYLYIDAGKWRDFSKSFITYWPEKYLDTVSFGAWSAPYATSYCETKLYKLRIYDKYLLPTDQVVREHLGLINII